MPSTDDYECIYNNIHVIEVTSGQNSDERSINIVIKKDCQGSLMIKLRDVSSYLFNYTTIIHKKNFLVMKKEQSLDINFDEFETHFLDMLVSNVNKQMFLKCNFNSDGSKCSLIFYEKSKIKSLILLTIELLITNQKELLDEMEVNLKILQDTNKSLTCQIEKLNHKLRIKEKEIMDYGIFIRETKENFMKDLKNLSTTFFFYLKQSESLLAEKIQGLSDKIMKMISDIYIVKNEQLLKSTSSARLLDNLENLRTDYLDNITVMNRLKMDCSKLEKKNTELELRIVQLTEFNKEKEQKLIELNGKVEEYKADLEKSAVIIAQKNDLCKELSQDMEQANQVIRNYNRHYENKVKEVDELKEALTAKDKMIKEQIFENHELFKDFQEYKFNFSEEEKEMLISKLTDAQNKVEIIEKEKRELVKINGLLTKKLSATNLYTDMNN